MKQRPLNPRINRHSPLWGSARFLGLAGMNCVGSAKYADQSAFGNTGTLTNMDPSTDWVFDDELGRWGISTNGTDQHVSCDSPVSSLSVPYTLSVKVRFKDLFPSQDYAIAITTSTSYRYTGLKAHRISGVNYLHFGSRLSSSGEFLATSTAYVQNEWVSMVGIERLTSRELWVDGVQSINTDTITPDSLTPTELTIGRLDYGAGIYWGNCDTADALAFNRILTPDEIYAISRPENVMLEVEGVPLLLPPHRMVFPVATTETPVTYSPMQFQAY